MAYRYLNNRAKKKIKTTIILIMVVLFAIVCIVGFFFGGRIVASIRHRSLSHDTYTNVFIDVGKGDCILIMSGSTTILIDGGKAKYKEHVVKRLEYYGIRRLDVVISSHPDSDHVGGLDYIIEHIPTDLIIMPNCSHDTKQFNQLIDNIHEFEIPVMIPDVGDTLELDYISLDFYSPPKGNVYNDTNEYSIACVARTEYGSVYLGGDSELVNEKAMLKLDLPDVDVYKASHHGSKTSNSYEFVAALSPEYAIIQCEDEKDKDRPDEEVLRIFEALDIDTYITEDLGEIIVRYEIDGIEIKNKSRARHKKYD